jgi:hypothetical protein
MVCRQCYLTFTLTVSNVTALVDDLAASLR